MATANEGAIFRYDVVCGPTDTNTFTERVNHKIAEGWEPFGNLVVLKNAQYDTFYFYQAIVKRVKQP